MGAHSRMPFRLRLRLQHADPSDPDKSQVLTSTHGNMAMMENAHRMLFGPLGGPEEKDALLSDNGTPDVSPDPRLEDQEHVEGGGQLGRETVEWH